MSNDYYFRKWKKLLDRLKAIVHTDTEFQEIKLHEKKLCGMVQQLSGMLGAYISIYNEALECRDQILQVQKTKYIDEIVQSISRRILELKHELQKLEHSNYQFLSGGLTNFKLTTADAEFLDIPKKANRPPAIQAGIDSVWQSVKEINEKLEEEERQRLKEEEELKQAQIVQNWWDTEDEVNDDQKEKEEVEVLDEKEIERLKMINRIKAQEKCRQVTLRNIQNKLKKEHWKIELLGLAQPQKRIEIRNKAAEVIRRYIRAYFAIKRKRIDDCRRDEILGLRLCKKLSDTERIKGEEITKKRIQLQSKYEEEWKDAYEKLKNKCMHQKLHEIKEDYREEIRDWFRTW